jgi:general secretion pathway protein G
VIYLKERSSKKLTRGGQAKALGRRVTTSRFGYAPGYGRESRGFTLIELVITITVMTILTLGVVPLLKISVKRQKEQQLRAALRQMRMAIDEFHRDTVGMQCTGVNVTPGGEGGGQAGGQRSAYIDPRSRVVITDCTVFGVDNPDRYPSSLDVLVDGVNVKPRAGFGDGRGVAGITAFEAGNPELATKKKIYLRSIPINPITGEKDWEFRSTYDAADAESWGGENVFDVIFPPNKDQYFKPMKEGEKYSDW